MRVLCVDDALPIMEDTVAMCRRLPETSEVTGFTRPREAMECLSHSIDQALLDIDMPEINGLMPAEQLKRPGTHVALHGGRGGFAEIWCTTHGKS